MYLHLAPHFLRNFFIENEDIIAKFYPEQYAEVVSMAKIVEVEPYLLLMLNYAFELHQALCTSIVARLPDGHVIHGRNLDFGFADTMRNSTFRA